MPVPGGLKAWRDIHESRDSRWEPGSRSRAATARNDMNESLLFGGFLFVLGVVFVTLGAIQFFQGRRRRRHWRPAEGTVIGPHDRDLKTDHEDPARPIIRFEDDRGVSHTFESDWTMAGLPGIGSKVRVLYDPYHPDRAIYHTGFSTLFMPLVIILAGIAVLRVAAYYLLDK